MSEVRAENTIQAGEAGILARLEAKVSGVATEAFPDNPGEYRLRHQRGALLVAYRGSEYSEPIDVGDVVQERVLLYDVHVLARRLSNHVGAHDILEAARIALTGHRVAGFKRITPRRERFVSQKEGVWIYALTVSMVTLAIELDDSIAGPLLQRLTAGSDYTTTETISG